jgi:4,5-DOPA dioxygenase extradiol
MQTLPAWFVGHGAPTLLQSDNKVRHFWHSLPQVLAQQTIVKPKAILSISAHWQTNELAFSGHGKQPEIQYDFYGFEEELYQLSWPLLTNESMGHEILSALQDLDVKVQSQSDYAIDHGTWVPLREAWPTPEIPVFQLSICPNKSVQWHYELGQKLAALRAQGILVIANGGISHNLIRIDWRRPENSAVDWASEFMQAFEQALEAQDLESLLNPLSLPNGKLAVPSWDHYLPFVVFLGLAGLDNVSSLYKGWYYGSLAVHSYSTQV